MRRSFEKAIMLGKLLCAGLLLSGFLSYPHPVEAAKKCQPTECMKCDPVTGDPNPMPDDWPCDLDDNQCTHDTCQHGYCLGGPSIKCDDGFICTSDRCDPSTGLCEVAMADVTKICRSATDICDTPEKCDGINKECPPDKFVDGGVICRAANGSCDTPEACSGTVAACPPDGFLAQNTVCRGSTGSCDPEEKCPGTGPACPIDTFVPSGISCADNTLCNGDETCDGSGHCLPELGGVVVCSANDECHNPGSCLADSGMCSQETLKEGYCFIDGECYSNGTTHPENPCQRCDSASSVNTWTNKPDGTALAPDGRICTQDVCIAGKSYHPSPATTVCRAKGGICDIPEKCDGTHADCPSDDIKPSSSVCRPEEGVCDLAEQCDGVNKDCPTDRVRSTDSACRISNGICDLQEQCDGKNKSCPVDRFLPSDVVCRKSNGICDVEEKCTGKTASCPGDVYMSAKMVCRPSGGSCDQAERCSGTIPTCPSDVFAPAGLSCGNSNQCDGNEVCDGKGECITGNLPPVYCSFSDECHDPGACMADQGLCTEEILRPGFCSIDDVCYPEGSINPDNPCEVCNTEHSSSEWTAREDDYALPEDHKDCTRDQCLNGQPYPMAEEGFICRSAVGECDLPEVCTGVQEECPQDLVSPAHTACVTTDNRPGECNGVSAACEPQGFLCGTPNPVDIGLSPEPPPPTVPTAPGDSPETAPADMPVTDEVPEEEAQVNDKGYCIFCLSGSDHAYKCAPSGGCVRIPLDKPCPSLTLPDSVSDEAWALSALAKDIIRHMPDSQTVPPKMQAFRQLLGHHMNHFVHGQETPVTISALILPSDNNVGVLLGTNQAMVEEMVASNSIYVDVENGAVTIHDRETFRTSLSDYFPGALSAAGPVLSNSPSEMPTQDMSMVTSIEAYQAIGGGCSLVRR